MRRFLFAGLGALTVLLSIPSAARAAGEEKDRIKEGESIGQVYIGMEASVMGKLLGEATESDAAMGRGTEAWFSKGKDGPEQEIVVDEHSDDSRDHRFVEQVAATSPFFHTALGNSVQSDLLVIWREFPGLRYAEANEIWSGPPLELYDDVDSGVAILVERTASPIPGATWGKCRAFIVHRPGKPATSVRLGRTPK